MNRSAVQVGKSGVQTTRIMEFRVPAAGIAHLVGL